MFARSLFKAAQPLKTQYRQYAAQPSGGSSNALLYAGVAAGLGGVGYYIYNQGDNAAKVHDAAHRAEDKVKDITGKAAAQIQPSGKKAFTGGDQGWINLELENVENVSHNSKKFRFKLPENDDVSGLAVASALLTKYKGPEMEKVAIRPYTPVSDEGEVGYLDLLVKVYPNGAMSSHLFEMTPGQSLAFKGPIPKYAWSENKHQHIALVAGGTGITPMYQLARAIFNNPNDKTKVTLVYGNLSEEDILLKPELEKLENKYPQRFRAFYTLDNAPEGSSTPKRITKDLLKTVLPEPKEENVKVFVCGPPGLYKAVSGGKKSPSDQGELDGYLKELGYNKEQVYKF